MPSTIKESHILTTTSNENETEHSVRNHCVAYVKGVKASFNIRRYSFEYLASNNHSKIYKHSFNFGSPGLYKLIRL